MFDLPKAIPEKGIEEQHAYDLISDLMHKHSAHLGAPDAFAHMDPWPSAIAAKLVGLNATFNQNLLHPDLSPLATEVENSVIDWFNAFFNMQSGHMCAGSTIANLTALWAARESGATKIITSQDAHISIAKCASILAMPIEFIATDAQGRIDTQQITQVSDVAVVLTAGTTGRGVIDPLNVFGNRHSMPAWLHIDAAWAGPLRLTRYKERLSGIELANSISLSAHKWLFQPKDSAMVLFKEPDKQDVISFGSAYLAAPNVGVQGSRSAAAIALLGTCLSLGVTGFDSTISQCMDLAEKVAERLQQDSRVQLKQFPETGVINWRPVACVNEDQEQKTARIIEKLGRTASSTRINNELWVRHVSANINADIDLI